MGLRSLLPSSPFVTLLLMLVLHRRPATGQNQLLYQLCDGRNDTANNTHGGNLGLLLPSLVANGSTRGFSADRVSAVPHRIDGVVLCRGDVGSGDCRACLATAAEKVVQECPNGKDAVVWYDNCILRYTEGWSYKEPLRIISAWDYSANMSTSGTVPAIDRNRYKEQLEKMMRKLASHAAYNNTSGSMFATGEAEFTEPFPMIYGLVQCSGGLAATDCHQSLTRNIDRILQSFSGRVRGRELGTDCYVMYELNTFYNGSAMVRIPSPIGASVPGPAPAIPPQPPSGVPTSRENKLQRVKCFSIIISVGIVLSLIGTTT